MIPEVGSGDRLRVVGQHEVNRSVNNAIDVSSALRVALFALILALSDGASARGKSDSNGGMPAGTRSASTNVGAYDVGRITVGNISSDSAKEDLFRQLLGTETPALSWPAFPRIWVERSITHSKQSNTSLGFQVPVVNTGAKLSIGFRYGLKTTLMIVSSLRPFTDRQSPPVDLSEALATNVDRRKVEASIIHLDPVTNVTYPRVRDGYPMIAFCSFEANLTMDKTGKTEIDFMGSGQSFEAAEVEVIQQTLFSNFFQVRPDISVRAYMEDVCGRIFRESVETQVVDDFSKMIVEKVLARNPNHQCEPPDPRIPDEVRVELGDASCLEWHRRSHGSAIRRSTVPRCQLRADGAYRCQVKARAGSSCPLYMSSESGKISENFSNRRMVRVAGYKFDVPCDKTQGLTCQMVSEPWMVLSQPAFLGRAVCAPASPTR
jgi:hypothetical protein